MEFFSETVNAFQLLIIFAKSFLIDVWRGCENARAIFTFIEAIATNKELVEVKKYTLKIQEIFLDSNTRVFTPWAESKIKLWIKLLNTSICTFEVYLTSKN